MQKYAEVRVLGQGSFGKAVLCRRKSDRRLVVVKEIRIESLSASEKADAFHEASILASLDHPFIVKYYESFEEGGKFFIVMEYADGGDLAKVIQQKSNSKLFPEEEVLRIFVQIALAIKYIHDKKILHRDLKCQNVFLMKDGTVKLGDFGIARVLEHTFQLCRTQIGTPYYLSPEICEGKNYNAKTDIWSLGCILYELCTLHHAFTAQNMNALFVNIILGRYDPIPKSFSNELQLLISRMLTYDSRMRPSINSVLATPMIKAYIRSWFPKVAGVKPAPERIRSAVSDDGGILLHSKRKQAELKRKELIIQEEMQRAKRIQEIVKRRRDADQIRKKQEVARRRKEQEERARRIEKVMKINLDTAGQIRYNEYIENREKAEENRKRAQGNIVQEKELWGYHGDKRQDMSWEQTNIRVPVDTTKMVPIPDVQVPVDSTRIIPTPDIQVPVNSTRMMPIPDVRVPVDTTHIIPTPDIQVPVETTRIFAFPNHDDIENTHLHPMQSCWHQVPVETTQIWSPTGAHDEHPREQCEGTPKQIASPESVRDATHREDGPSHPGFDSLLPQSPPTKLELSPRLILSPTQKQSPILKKPNISDASPVRTSIRKAVSIDSGFLDASVSIQPPRAKTPSAKVSGNFPGSYSSGLILTQDERRQQMQKQREELEASRKMLLEMGMKTKRQMEDLSPLVPTISKSSHRGTLSRSLGGLKTRSRSKSYIEDSRAHYETDNETTTQIHELQESVKTALALSESDDDATDEFEISEPSKFYFQDRELSFPVVKDSDSLTYRAEAIRAFLEKELGIERLLELTKELELQNAGLDILSQLCQQVHPGVVILLQQLIILDQLIASS